MGMKVWMCLTQNLDGVVTGKFNFRGFFFAHSVVLSC